MVRIGDMTTMTLPVRSPIRTESTGFAAILIATEEQATAVAGVSGQKSLASASTVDFTSMTRRDLFDWMNDKIKSGEMSLDDSRGFLGMASQMAVGADLNAAIMPDDQERVDFVQAARTRLSNALERREVGLADLMKTTISVMQDHQAMAFRGRTVMA